MTTRISVIEIRSENRGEGLMTSIHVVRHDERLRVPNLSCVDVPQDIRDGLRAWLDAS